MRNVWRIVALTMLVPALAMSQVKIQKLAVSGYPSSVPVTQINGKNYVEVEALTQLVSGSLSFHGNQMTLSLTGNPAPTTAENVGFSKDFLRAGIEEMSTIRDWHTALTTAIENQFPVTPVVMNPYETAAAKNLRLAQVAATTDADHKAAELITNEFQKMKQLNDGFLAQRAAATYINADALTNNTLNQSVIACGRSLAAMAASGQFTDDPTCR